MFFLLPPQAQYETLNLEVACDGHEPVKRFPTAASGAGKRVAIKIDPDRVARKSALQSVFYSYQRSMKRGKC